MLYPENMNYLSDMMSYVAVGARSVENQFHRLVASGCDVPVGMKNPTSGDLTVMLNSVVAAQLPHDFIFRGFEVQCPGNPLTHTILRGAVNKRGQCNPNYHYEDLKLLFDLYNKRGLQNPCLLYTSLLPVPNRRFQLMILDNGTGKYLGKQRDVQRQTEYISLGGILPAEGISQVRDGLEGVK